MANTKKTPKKSNKIKCHVCFEDFENESCWEKHIIGCARKKRQTLHFFCQVSGCKYVATRKTDLNRHINRKHGNLEIESDSEWEKCNPGSLSDIIGDTEENDDQLPSQKQTAIIEKNPCVRKATSPNPVAAPIKKKLLDSLSRCMEPIKVTPPRTTATLVRSTVTSTSVSTPVATSGNKTVITTTGMGMEDGENQSETLSAENALNDETSTVITTITDSGVTGSIPSPCTPTTMSTPIEISASAPTGNNQDGDPVLVLTERRRPHTHRRRKIIRYYTEGKEIEEIEEEEWQE